ncbi:Transcriptional regulator, AraC family [Paenibacillus pasadenensis]|uniref:Transcriptional regulator, AraC family n=1 Tax=Paenibacillus pasadenensis TaxID=217090 RepID=A0A2N5NCU2_9BACL|nr:AraC family transcriptional regulator [Paenibacillus pasadenensis]PLT48169.1 Transcriptional regulator, AraC family [Paenibacillus pasadenensis]
MRENGMTVALLAASVRGMAARGLDTGRFCREAGLDPELLRRGDARIAHEEMARLMDEAARFAGDPLFGLHQGAEMELADLGVAGYVVQHCATAGEAVQAMNKYHEMICSGYELKAAPAENGLAELRFRLNNPALEASRHCTEDMVASLCRSLLRLVGRPVELAGVSFRHAPAADPERYRDVFGLDPEFEAAQDAIRLPAEVLDWPVLARDERLRQEFQALADRMLDSLAKGQEMTNELSRYLLERTGAAPPTLAAAARSLGMSARTLQAKLQREGATFAGVAAEMRRKLAVRYLAKQELSVAEVAYLLHFSEPSAFHGAFKRWTGMTPGQYRHGLAAEAGQAGG